MTFSRVCGFSGIGFVIMIVLGNAVLVPAGLPLTGAAPREAAAFFGTQQGAVALSSALTPAAWVLATLFGAGAVAALWPVERERGEAWSLVGFAGLILQNSAFAGVIALRLALAEAAHDGSAVEALWALEEALFTLNGTFLAVALTGLSIGGARAGLTPRWHAGLGLLSAALNFASATLTPLVMEHGQLYGLVGLSGWLLWAAWLVGYGVILIRHEPRPVTA
ncbi:hypothetical protein CLV63_10457 [Murinocardiopsis flavida]|uniref:DUF4386 family protein n=1 Tax=Murinocardiopsis flavida TaxID=645275 RepID=A0A2P8DNQ7_9ACTN|nr:hypothetical protein [Murinocardiopsis flavida]PSK98833.1 hypothetical protein CLV63_10457 [Murinocardiopsis flavida]